MDLKRCPVCNTVLEKRVDRYYCQVCNLIIPKKLEKRIFVFGVSKKCKEISDILVNKLNGYCMMIPLRAKRITMVKSFQYFKTLLKKLRDAEADYICVDMQVNRVRELPFLLMNNVENELLLGIEPVATYKIREFYIIVGRRTIRICSKKMARYKELYGLLLFIASYIYS